MFSASLTPAVRGFRLEPYARRGAWGIVVFACGWRVRWGFS